MSDEDAYMALALNNAQGELHPLEVGLHALKGSLSQEAYGKAYGKAVGLSQDSISLRVKAARVADTTGVVDPDRWRHLAEIHAAPRWLWAALVAAMLDKGWFRAAVLCCKRSTGRSVAWTFALAGAANMVNKS